jgi:hypothetical protein
MISAHNHCWYRREYTKLIFHWHTRFLCAQKSSDRTTLASPGATFTAQREHRETSSTVAHRLLMLLLLSQPTTALDLICLVQNQHDAHASILANLLAVLANQYGPRLALFIRIASVLKVADEAEVHRRGGEPAQRESRRRGPVELVAE